MVPQGGLTGLCGGARAGDGEIALSLERMVGIEEIDPATATMTVLAGTPLERVQQAADAAGFLCPLDLGARGSCAIGGNIATNAGGNRVIRYGMTREMVLGLEVVLADGTVLTSLNKLIKNNAGYDLKHLFIGSEGTLGIVTRAVLRLHPKPSCVQAALCGLASFEALIELLKGARAGLGPTLSAFEVMWSDYYRFVTTEVRVRPPIGDEHAIYALVEAQGTDEAADNARFEGWLERMLEQGIIADAALAQSLAEVQSFWTLRDSAGEFRQTPLGPDHVSFDIGLPTGAMGTYVDTCRRQLESALPGLIALFYGHIGDGNLHIVAAMPGAADAAQGDDRPRGVRAGAGVGRHGLGRARDRDAEEAVAGVLADGGGDCADADAEGGAGSGGHPQSGEGAVASFERRGSDRGARLA